MTELRGSSYRQGQRLGPGIYAYRGELHIDEAEFIRGTGGDPDNPGDVAAARAAIQRVSTSASIPVDEVTEAIWP